MKLTYIYHSGFSIEEEHFIIIVDFYRDTKGEKRGYVHDVLLHENKRIYVLSTHFHEDHFNSEVLGWSEIHPDIIYIFSKDILRHRFISQDKAFWVVKGGSYVDNNIFVSAFGSTDVGVSFYIKTGSFSYFHAGDLNNWHWNEESSAEESSQYEKAYLGELKDICKEIKEVDIVMFPVDARLGKDYQKGPYQFLQKVKSHYFIPMHFTSKGYASANAFKEVSENMGCHFLSLFKEGDSFHF